VRTDNASLLFDRQRIVSFSAPWADSASLRLVSGRILSRGPPMTLHPDFGCTTTPAGNRWRPLRGGSHARRTRGAPSRHYPTPRWPTRPSHLRRRRPLCCLVPQVVGPLPAVRPRGSVRPDAGQPPRRPAHPARAGKDHPLYPPPAASARRAGHPLHPDRSSGHPRRTQGPGDPAAALRTHHRARPGA
jgi:hypothetical protein